MNLLKFFKKEKPKVHPEVKKPISYAFTIDDQDYYEFDNLLDMPVMRYNRTQQFLVELNMRITRDKLIQISDKILEQANSGDLTKIVLLATDLKNRTEFLIETDTFYRLATAVFFTMEENLEEYDFDFNEKKLDKFKEQKVGDFFFKRPVKKLIPQINISPKDLETYLKMTAAQMQYESQILGLKRRSDSTINKKKS